MAREPMEYLSVMIPADLRADLDAEVAAREGESGGSTLAGVVRERLSARAWGRREAVRLAREARNATCEQAGDTPES